MFSYAQTQHHDAGVFLGILGKNDTVMWKNTGIYNQMIWINLLRKNEQF